MLADLGVLKQVRATCFQWSQPPGIHVTTLKKAGAIYVDEPVVVSGLIVTGRDPADMGQFMQEMLKQLELD